jgi:hypothetical protein
MAFGGQAEVAVERYSAFRAGIKASAPNARPLVIGQEYAIVEDALQLPQSKVYCPHLTEPRFRVRGAYEYALGAWAENGGEVQPGHRNCLSERHRQSPCCGKFC